MSEIGVIIVAGGRGERLGGAPKQFRDLAGRSVLAHSVLAFTRRSDIGPVVVVIPNGSESEARWTLGSAAERVLIVTGGASRTASVRAGLAALGGRALEVVLIHDAARPLVSGAVIDRVLSGLVTADATAPALPLPDALKRLDGEMCIDVDRSPLRAVQTPQGFRFAPLQEAYRALGPEDALPDDIAVASAAGLRVRLVDGDVDNFKITYPEDVARAERVLDADVTASGGRRSGSAFTTTGFGYDVHRTEPGEAITLCGVTFPSPVRLVGHSDADLALHAITDAILGAIGAGDIGEHFPPSDPRWRGAESVTFLDHAGALARSRGARLVHVDVTIVGERPKISPHRPSMRGRLAQLLNLDPERASVKATTTEKLGFTGRGEGLAAYAVATLMWD